MPPCAFWVVCLLTVDIPLSCAQVQFSTHLNDNLEQPVFKKGAAFVFKYQAVTSESESKVRVFSPFPQMPTISLTRALAVVEAFKTKPRGIGSMYVNTRCEITNFNNTYTLLLEQLETRVRFLQLELAAATEEEATLMEVARSFIPPSMKQDSAPKRQRRAICAIAAIAAGAGMILGEPVKEAACTALSIFNLCRNDDALSKDVDQIMTKQKTIIETLQRVQSQNDQNFFLLGNEIKGTQESVTNLRDKVGERFQQIEYYLVNATRYLTGSSLECDKVIVRHIHLLQYIRNYIYQLGTLYTHLKSYRAAFYAYRISLFTTISSLASGYITPQFLLPKQVAEIVKELAEDEVLRGTKLSPAIRPGFEAIYYEIQLVLEVTPIPRGISVILGIPMNSKSSTFDIYHATPLYQPNNDQKTASLFSFTNPFLAVSTDNSRFAELGANTLQQCSGINRIKLCRKGFSATTDETLLYLGSLFYNYDIPALRNCEVKSVLLPDAPQAFYLAEGMYHIISRAPHLQIKNDSRATDLSISTINCQACVMRPSCSSIISFNQGDLVLYPDMDFCETNPEPFLASIELTPSLNKVFSHVPSISNADFHAYSLGEARQSVLGTLRLELAELPDVDQMTEETLDELTQPIASYYSAISPATSAALESYLPTRTAILMSTLSITISLLTFSISFTLFRRQWRRLFTNPQIFFRGHSGRFIHIVNTASDEYEETDPTFLYLTVMEFQARVSLAREKINQPIPPNTNYTIPKAPCLPPRVYPDVAAPQFSETNT